MTAKNEINNVYGKLTVLRRGKNVRNIKFRGAFWECLCECGNIVHVSGGNLRSGATKSCGCNHYTGITLEAGEAEFRQVIINYKRHAKNRGYSWKLSSEFAKKTMAKDCYYCGSKPSNTKKSKTNRGDFHYNGIDRVDNTKDYTEDNVVPCCCICNRMKSDIKYSDFIMHIKKVIKKYEETNTID